MPPVGDAPAIGDDDLVAAANLLFMESPEASPAADGLKRKFMRDEPQELLIGILRPVLLALAAPARPSLAGQLRELGHPAERRQIIAEIEPGRLKRRQSRRTALRVLGLGEQIGPLAQNGRPGRPAPGPEIGRVRIAHDLERADGAQDAALRFGESYGLG